MSMILKARQLGIFLSTLFAMFMILASASFAQEGPPPGSPPTFTAAYSPTDIGPGATSTLTYTIDNTAIATPTTDLDFTHNLPANVMLATPPSAATTCTSGTLTAASGGSSVAYTTGSVAGSSSCTVSVNVTSSTVGGHTNSTGDLTSSAGNSGPAATNTLTVSTTAPGFFQSFAPSSVTAGGVSTLTYTIDNTANTGDLSAITFADTLTTGLTIASPANASTTCNASSTLTATAGTNTVSFSHFGILFPGFEALSAGATCAITVDVTSTTVGTHTNTSGALSYTGTGVPSLTSAGTSTAALTVTGVAAGEPLISKSFTNDPVNPGGTVTLDYTITNTDRNFSATAVAFTEDLTATLADVTFASLLSNDCGGSVAGGSTTSINFTGGTIAVGSSCTISVSLQLGAAVAGGTYASTSGAVSATVNGSPVVGNMASDNLNVQLGGGAPTVTLSLTSANPGGTTVATYTVTNTSTGSSLTDLAFVTDFPSDTIATASVTPGNGLCGVGSIGTFTPLFNVPGSPVIPARLTISAGALAPAGTAGDSCTFMITLNIEATAPTGPRTVTTSAPTSTVGAASVTSSPASGVLTVGAGGGNLAVDLAKTFSVASALPGEVVGLTFTITNRAESTDTATDISFTDDLDTFLAGTTLTSVRSNDCGATVAGTGTGTITVTGGSRDVDESCTISTTITLGGGTPGDITNQTSGVSAGLNGGAVGVVGSPASANLSVNGFTPLTFTQSFTDDPVIAGDTVTLEYRIVNTNAVDATGMLFTHDLNAVISGLAITGALPTDPCGAGSTLTGTTLLILAGGNVLANSSCTFLVTLQVPGMAANNSYGSVTSNLFATIGGTASVGAAASDSLVVNSANLLFSKSFTDTSVFAGSATTLEFTLQNTNAGSAITDVEFTDDLGAMNFKDSGGSTLAGTTFDSVAFNDCGATVTGTGTDTITVASGSLAAEATCNIRVLMTPPGATASGSYTNSASTLSGMVGALPVTGDSANADLQVFSTGSPTFSKSFAGPVQPNGTTQLTFTIANPGAVALSDMEFSDDLNSALAGLVATSLPPSPCGAGSSIIGTSFLAFTGGTVAAGGSCNFDVGVTAPTGAAAGSHANTTSNLTSSGLTLANPATASLTVEPAPTFAKAFGPTSVAQGAPSTLTFTIINTASSVPTASLAFTDTLPTGLVVAAAPNASTTCTGGTVTAAAGTGSVSYTGGTVAAGASCTVVANVSAEATGVFNNTSGDLTSNAGNSGTAAASLTVTAAPLPTFVKAFGSSIAQGGTTTLAFTITNTALVDATVLAFTDNMPAALQVAANPGVTNTCTGGTVTAAAGTSLISYTGGTVGASGNCIIMVNVTSDVAGPHSNTSGALTSSLGTSSTANASLTVTNAPIPTFSKEFSPSSIVQGTTSTLIFTINNGTALIDATALAFSDTFPAGITVASTPNASTTCTGGTITAAAGAGLASYSGGTASASATCTVSVDVTSTTLGALSNTSGALTSSLGSSGTASAQLTVTDAPTPTFSKAFTAGTIVQGGVDTLVFTVDNSATLIDATALTFSDTFPTGMIVATTPNASTTCTGGTITAAAGAALASYSGGTVGASATCTVSVDVTSATVGASVNISDALSSSLGASGTATASLTITEAGAPAFSKTFSPSSIVQGETSTLTFTVDNSSAATDATSLAFSDTFPTGMTVAATPNTSTTCTGGVITATAGSGTVTFADGTATSSSSCTVSIDVTSSTVGDATNSSGDLTSSLGNSGIASATLAITSAPTPNFSMAFAPSTIVQDSTSTLTFTVDNSSALVDATGLAFNNVFPAGMTVATTPNIASTCGGVVTADAGSDAIGFSGGTSAASGSCTVAVDITSNAVGALANTSNALNSSLGTSAAASATLTVTANPIAQVTIIQVSDTDSTFGFSSAESLLNFNISTAGGSGTQGPVSLTAGTYVIAQARPEGFGNVSLNCSDANSIGVSATGELTLNLEARESVTCTYTSVDSLTPTRQAINDFLNRRITQILNSEPSNGRRIGRLKGKFGGNRIVSFTKGDLGSLMPVNFDLKTLGSGNYNISGSLSQAAAAIVRHPLSLDGATDGDVTINNSRFDVWFEASYNRFNGSQGSSGHFGVAYLGADYLYSKDLLIGFLVQFDDIEDRSVTLNKTVDGTGWMAGPYVTARIAPNLYFDGRFAIGRSSNFLDLDLNNTTGLPTGNFDTSRWLVNASLVGDVDLGKWQMQPNLSVSYMEESQKAFVDSINVSQPGQTVSQGQVRIGPNFSTRIENDNGTIFEPSFTFDGIFSFGNSDGTLIASVADETDGLRGRVEAGVNITTRKNVRVELGFNYDGIGKSDYESYGARLTFSMPF